MKKMPLGILLFIRARATKRSDNTKRPALAGMEGHAHVGDTIELIPDNDGYDTIILDKDHPGRILGKKIQMIRYGSR